MPTRTNQHDHAAAPSTLQVFVTAVWCEVAMGLMKVILICLLATFAVHITTALITLGPAALDPDLPIPIAMRRTLLVFIPVGVTAITVIGLVVAVAARQPFDHVQSTVRRLRRLTLTLGITAAWFYFPISYNLGPMMGLLGACIGALGASLLYRRIARAQSRRAQPDQPNRQPISQIDELYLDV